MRIAQELDEGVAKLVTYTFKESTGEAPEGAYAIFLIISDENHLFKYMLKRLFPDIRRASALIKKIKAAGEIDLNRWLPIADHQDHPL